MFLRFFKAQKQTKRFRKNQKVWVVHDFSNHLHIRFKWRGKGRYVIGIISKDSQVIGEMREIEVANDFGCRVLGLLKLNTI